MGATTALGQYLRVLRVQNSERLFDLAQALSVRSAFLSAVETGKKPAPESLLEKIAEHYKLAVGDSDRLRLLAAQSAPSLKVSLSGAKSMNRELAVVFARRFDDLDEEEVRRVMGILREKEPGGDGEMGLAQSNL